MLIWLLLALLLVALAGLLLMLSRGGVRRLLERSEPRQGASETL